MTIKEEARVYALNALENEISRIEQAYIDGYNTAKAKYSTEAVVDEENNTITVAGKTSEPIEWVDLSLPSGTQWSLPVKFKDDTGKPVVMGFPYNQVKDLSLPSSYDIDELKKYTKLELYAGYAEYKDINGKIFRIDDRRYWISQGENGTVQKKSMNNYGKVGDQFMGDDACIILAKI